MLPFPWSLVVPARSRPLRAMRTLTLSPTISPTHTGRPSACRAKAVRLGVRVGATITASHTAVSTTAGLTPTTPPSAGVAEVKARQGSNHCNHCATITPVTHPPTNRAGTMRTSTAAVRRSTRGSPAMGTEAVSSYTGSGPRDHDATTPRTGRTGASSNTSNTWLEPDPGPVGAGSVEHHGLQDLSQLRREAPQSGRGRRFRVAGPAPEGVDDAARLNRPQPADGGSPGRGPDERARRAPHRRIRLLNDPGDDLLVGAATPQTHRQPRCGAPIQLLERCTVIRCLPHWSHTL